VPRGCWMQKVRGRLLKSLRDMSLRVHRSNNRSPDPKIASHPMFDISYAFPICLPPIWICSLWQVVWEATLIVKWSILSIPGYCKASTQITAYHLTRTSLQSTADRIPLPTTPRTTWTQLSQHQERGFARDLTTLRRSNRPVFYPPP
jgi:hypothetical protein